MANHHCEGRLCFLDNALLLLVVGRPGALEEQVIAPEQLLQLLASVEHLMQPLPSELLPNI